jgi:hypothetical protein
MASFWREKQLVQTKQKKKKNLNTRAHDLKNPWPCTNVCFFKTNIAHIPKRIKLTIAMHNRICA